MGEGETLLGALLRAALTSLFICSWVICSRPFDGSRAPRELRIELGGFVPIICLNGFIYHC